MRRLLLAATMLAALPTYAQDKPANAALGQIMDQGLNHSQVMATAQYMDDVIGPRMTNSPNMRKAEAWTQAKYREWGLTNVHKEAFPFGRGWSIERSSVRMTAPRPIQLTAIPIAWTPATNGTLTAPVVVAPLKTERDFAKWRGKLAGKIVLVSEPGTGSEPDKAPFQRLTDEDLGKLNSYKQDRYDPADLERGLKRDNFPTQMEAFLKAEGALAYATMAYRDGKLVSGEGYRFAVGDTPPLPAVQIAAEDYRRLVRLAVTGQTPTLEIISDVRFDDSDTNAYNIIADIPGTDPKAGYVMAGAHLDSWIAGDGAADNGAGSAMIMEAARILAATGVRPKRTIRFALWAGEEQALLGSIAYVEQHLANRAPGKPFPPGQDIYYQYPYRWPIVKKPGWGDLAAYFNIDNGSGKLRGIYAENNPAVVPIFQEWMQPFRSMGMNTVSIQRTGGTDHVFMQSVGVPGFQFIQDPLDYGSRVHHTSIDTFDHLKADDMRQGATVLASFLLNAANAAQPLPRPPLPTEPVTTDPYQVKAED